MSGFVPGGLGIYGVRYSGMVHVGLGTPGGAAGTAPQRHRVMQVVRSVQERWFRASWGEA
jgi:hypothetical protein